jgi:hypothetical protein
MGIQDVEWEHGLDCSDSGWRQATGSYECGNELSGSKKFGELLD